MARSAPAEMLCHGIRRAEQALTARHESVLRGHGLTMPQYFALLELSRSDGMSGAQLAKAAGVTPQTMATILANLEAKKLITREPSTVHAKVLIATLTKSGRSTLDAAYDDLKVFEEELNGSFSAKEYAALCDLLTRATDVLARQAAR